MKKLGWVVMAALSYSSWAASIGCGGISKQELETVKAELLAHDEMVKSQLKSELLNTDSKYALVQQIANDVKNHLGELAKLEERLTVLSKSVDDRANVATGNSLKVVQFEEKLMSERLAELRSLIEELKKK